MTNEETDPSKVFFNKLSDNEKEENKQCFEKWAKKILKMNNTVYIVGPMTGLPDYNKEGFDRAEAYLRGLDRYKFIINPWKLCPHEADLDTIIRLDLAAVMSVNELYVLKGYYGSAGATAEIAVAKWRKIKITYEYIEGPEEWSEKQVKDWVAGFRIVDK